MDKIILYSLPTCPRCKVIEMKLQKLGYEVERCMDEEEIKKLGVKSVPQVKYKDLPIMDFGAAINWIKTLGGST